MCEWTRNLTVLSVPEESWSFEVLYIIFHVRFINSFQTRTTRSFLILISSCSSSSFLLSFLFSTLLHNVCLVSFNFVQGTFETNRKKKLVTDFIEPNTAIKKIVCFSVVGNLRRVLRFGCLKSCPFRCTWNVLQPQWLANRGLAISGKDGIDSRKYKRKPENSRMPRLFWFFQSWVDRFY